MCIRGFRVFLIMYSTPIRLRRLIEPYLAKSSSFNSALIAEIYNVIPFCIVGGSIIIIIFNLKNSIFSDTH